MKTSVHAARMPLSAGIAVTLAIGMLVVAQTAHAAGPTPVGLGSATSFAILAGAGITNTGNSVINGDIGSFGSSTSITGFPPGLVATGTNHGGDDVTQGAKNDLGTAYDNAAGRTPFTTVAGGTLAGLTLVGGVYNAGGFTLGLNGTLTLNGENDPSSVWIFQATSDLIVESSSSVKFINGAQPCNVFWQVTSSATLKSGSTFAGTILASTSITMGDAVTLNGRALARTGNVTMINDTITSATCAPAAPTTAPTTAPTGSPGPSVPSAALSRSEPSGPIGTLLFVLVAIGSLGALATANVRMARRHK